VEHQHRAADLPLPIVVRADHSVTNGIERGYSAFLFAEERLFCRRVAEERSKRARQGTDETLPDFEEAIVVFHVQLEPGSLDFHRPISRVSSELHTADTAWTHAQLTGCMTGSLDWMPYSSA
jgi:hypothetical protein